MRVFRARNRAGFQQTEFGGEPAQAIIEARRKREKNRRRVGQEVGFAVAASQGERAPPQFNGHGLPRSNVLTANLDAVTRDAIVAEAERRGVGKSTIVRRLLEAVVEDDLFVAVLGEVEQKWGQA